MRRSHRKKSDIQVSLRNTKVNTVISKTGPSYDATNLYRADNTAIKQSSDVPITSNPYYEVSTKSSNSKGGECEYNYALPYQIKEHSDCIKLDNNPSYKPITVKEARLTVFSANNKAHQSSCSAATEQCHYVNAYVANTKQTGEDEDCHCYSTVK